MCTILCHKYSEKIFHLLFSLLTLKICINLCHKISEKNISLTYLTSTYWILHDFMSQILKKKDFSSFVPYTNWNMHKFYVTKNLKKSSLMIFLLPFESCMILCHKYSERNISLLFSLLHTEICTILCHKKSEKIYLLELCFYLLKSAQFYFTWIQKNIPLHFFSKLYWNRHCLMSQKIKQNSSFDFYLPWILCRK